MADDRVTEIKKDIDRCSLADSLNNNDQIALFNEMYGKYSNYQCFPNLETNPLFLKMHKDEYRNYLGRIKGFLLSLINNSNDYSQKNDSENNIHSPLIQIINSNSNDNYIVIPSFSEAKESIGRIDGLESGEKEEILKKILEIEQIVESHDSKKDKWNNLKSIISWLADKSVDVAISILPLLLKIG